LSERKDVVVQAPTIEVVVEFPPATIWTTNRYAQDWFADAMREGDATGYNARRREIIFAVCFADSYLAEWLVGDIGLDLTTSRAYLPAHDKRGVTDRWKEIPKELVRNNVIPAAPDLGGPHGEEWRRLVDYRDGLVHANASRPQTTNQPPELEPMPSRPELEELEPGWPLRVAVERVRRLHAAAGTSPPDWLL
jgi:hypothetical protein